MNAGTSKRTVIAANEVYRMPPQLFDARCAACWFMLGLAALTVALLPVLVTILANPLSTVLVLDTNPK